MKNRFIYQTLNLKLRKVKCIDWVLIRDMRKIMRNYFIKRTFRKHYNTNKQN